MIILHLYYDLCNLYGESGNVKAMKNYLEELGIETVIKFSTLHEKINLDNVDIVYIGSSTEENQYIVLNHLKQYKKELKKYISNGGFVLATGNAIELFGKTIDNEKGLNIFDYDCKTISFRLVDEALFKNNNNYILGFINRNRVLKNKLENHLFEVVKGIGDDLNANIEGIKENNFYGTYLIGPLLVRNPYFLSEFMNKIILFKYPDFVIKKVNLDLEEKAYQEFMKNYYSEYLK